MSARFPVVAAALAALALAGTASSGPSLTETCIQPGDGASVVQFAARDGTALVGVVFGAGSRGVVLGHRRYSDLCEWRAYALRLAGLGYRVLAFDFRGYGSSGPAATAKTWSRLDQDISAAVGKLRDLGAEKVVVVGASMAGTASLVATALLKPKADAVVSLSGPRDYGTLRALPAARKLRLPVLYLAAQRDGLYAADARRLFRATKSKDKKLFLLAGSDHGSDLLQGAAAESASTLLETFLTRVTATP
jgi:pimeloyl-ACP methyl ester carboxylesterase